MFSQLADRKLWYDGILEVDPSTLPSYIFQGVKIQDLAITHDGHDLEVFNKYVTKAERISIKTEIDEDRLRTAGTWLIPDEYKYLDVREFLISLVNEIVEDDLYDERVARLVHEIERFEQAEMFQLIPVIKFVLDRFRENGVIWGVGRGSSCASYIFYLMGLHEVDPVSCEIDLEEFLKYENIKG